VPNWKGKLKMSKHPNARETFANRIEGRVRRDDRRQARNAKRAFLLDGLTLKAW
jgi:hypothetical protein